MTGRLAMSAVSVALAGAAVAGAQGTGHGSTGIGSAGPGQTVTAALGQSTQVTGPPRGTRAEQTFPRLVPRTAKRASRVAVYFTLADRPGHAGVTETSYRVQTDAPPGSRAACQAMGPPTVDSGSQGAVVRVSLPRPVHGWCVGRYTVSVFLQRGPYCPKPAPGQPPQPCPEFATRDLDVGHAQLTVRHLHR